MSKRYVLLTTLLSSGLTLAILVGVALFFDQAIAAPAVQVTNPGVPAHISVSALVFTPVDQDIPYLKNTARQLLTINRQSRNNNIFVAPLTLPDRAILTGITLFGEDFDSQGAVQVRLKRCDHGQARCLSLAQPTSTNAFALGQFETVKMTNLSEVVDNNFYSYHLELEITALANSGLRSVRVELTDRSNADSFTGPEESWQLSGNVTNFLIPNRGQVEVRVCTDDLSDLPNFTHYPTLVVDSRSIPLGSNECRVVVGSNIEIRRSLNTRSSSGTYQILR